MRTAKRDRRKEAFWRKAIGGQRRSGLCVRAWCRQHELRESSFHWWRRELARRDGESRSEPAHEPQALTLVPVHVTTDPSTPREFDSSARNGSRSRIEIVLPNQGRVRLTGQCLLMRIQFVSHPRRCPRRNLRKDPLLRVGSHPLGQITDSVARELCHEASISGTSFALIAGRK